MVAYLLPTSEVVAKAWIQTVAGLPNPNQVGTTLPDNVDAWKDSGFIQLTTAAGSPLLDLPVARPVIQLDFWTVNPGSNNAPKGKANHLAELVRAASYLPVGPITLPSAFKPARLLSARLMTEPRPVPGNPAGYARYTADLSINWVMRDE